MTQFYSKKIKNYANVVKNSGRLTSFLRKKTNKHIIDEIILSTYFLPKSCTFYERIFCILNDIEKKPTCINCSANISFTSKKEYSKYCVKCSQLMPETKNKRKDTLLKKYGVEHYAQTKEYKEKIKKTNLEKYDVEHYSKTNEFKERVKQTSLKKYGVKHHTQTSACKKRFKQTNLERYGVEHYSKTNEFKERIKQTNLERYGVDNFTKKHIPQETLDKLNDKDWMYNEHIIKEVPLTQISKKLNLSASLAGKYLNKCGIQAQYYDISSKQEKELQEYISSLTTNVITNIRSVISPLELDIYLPDYQLAFEFNGLYWHSHSKLNDKFYHIKKTNACKEQGIQLIHIFEHEWLFKQDIVKSKINSLLGLNQVIYSSECQIKEISYNESKIFLDRTHIHGSIDSNIKIGLYHQNKLISLMTFGKLRCSEKYELLRFNSELNIDVVGAESKLFNYFIKVYKPKYVVFYCNLRYETGNVYENIGLNLSNITDPNYFYFKGYDIITRKQLFERFDPDLTEYQIITEHGWDKIYDCGSQLWIYKY